MKDRLLISVAAAAALAFLIGCGSSGSGGETTTASVPGGGNTEDVRVIGAWVDALRAGDIDKASSYFALPSTAQNGTPPVRLRNRGDVVSFNNSLPCGAKLVEASTEGQVTTATFELTARPGGDCGPGTGQTARTAFVIQDGLIVHWSRVGGGGGSPGPDQSKSSGQLS
jgi:hypothetical protein